MAYRLTNLTQKAQNTGPRGTYFWSGNLYNDFDCSLFQFPLLGGEIAGKRAKDALSSCVVSDIDTKVIRPERQTIRPSIQCALVVGVEGKEGDVV